MRALLCLFTGAVLACGQSNFSLCDVNRDGAVDVRDAQVMINQAQGKASPANDFAGLGVIGVVDVQTEINSILFGCSFYSPTPRFAVTNVTLLNRAWIPSDIPSAGNLTIRGAVGSPATLLNQAWISADIPAAGNLTIHGTVGSPATVLNQAWISADIPSPGNIAVTGAVASPVSVLNQAWISADIPSPGNLRFAVGLLVTLNNTATAGSFPALAGQSAKVIAAGSSTAPVDLASVNDGDTLIAGQTVRFRIYPPGEAISGSDFLVNGAALRIHTPFEALLTVPAHVSSLDIQAMAYSLDGQTWRTPAKRLQVLADPGLVLSGRALRDGDPAVSAAIGTRANGLAAEYFQADRGLAGWSDLNRPADKRGFVTALNQPETVVFGPDPFGTGLAGAYASRYRGQILVSTAGTHEFFLAASLGARLVVDGNALIDLPAGHFSPEAAAALDLTAGWHPIEIDSYHTASNPGLQLSWRQPNSEREVVRPEALAADLNRLAVTDAHGSFRLESFPAILNPLEWHAVPADSHIRIVLDTPTLEERPIQP